MELKPTNPKISIIIPVYNCEKYLDECLTSALNQTIHPKEIICINDGSSDNSDAILNRFEETYEEIKVFHQNNLGAGAARNLGLDIAEGEYVAFLDADDRYRDKNALESMYELCKMTKVKACRALKDNTDGTVCDREHIIKGLLQEKGEGSVISYIDHQFDYDYMSYIFERKLLIDHQIRFPMYRRYQDPPFLVKALYLAENIGLCGKWLYSYRKPVLSMRFDIKKVQDLLDAVKENIAFAKEHNLQLLLQKSIDRIEYDYFDIINHYSVKDKEIVRRLETINEIVFGDSEERRLRPLKFIQSHGLFGDENYEEELIDEIESEKKIFIFGAGHFGNQFYKFLKLKHLENNITSFLVSNKSATGIMNGFLITCAEEIVDRTIPVFVAVSGELQKQIGSMLNDLGFDKIIFLNTYFLDSENWKIDRDKDRDNL